MHRLFFLMGALMGIANTASAQDANILSAGAVEPG